MRCTQRHEMHTHLIKTSDDLIQQSEAVHAFVFDLLLFKVFIKAGNGSKHDTDLIVGLGVKFLKHLIMAGKNNALYWTLFYTVKVWFHLIVLAPVQKMSCHMHGKDVVQQTLVVFP